MKHMILASLFGFFLLILATTSVLAPDDKPEKLTLGGTGYNHDTGNFELQVSSSWGSATGGERADFQIIATLVIRDDTGVIDILQGMSPVLKADGRPGSRIVVLEDLLVRWDRGTVTGFVDVEATAALTKNGITIAEDSRTDVVFIRDVP